MRELTPEVVVADEPLTFLRPADMRDIIARARSVPRRRARILLHGSLDDVMQEMLIVMTRGQYVPPIWNDRSPKSYLLLSGSFKLIRFDESHEVKDCFRLVADEPGEPFFARINRPMWHMCISESPEVVFMETILGPHRGTVFADWAPAPENRPAAVEFFKRICDRCGIPSDPAEPTVISQSRQLDADAINAAVGVALRDTERVLLGPRASYELHHDPRHLVFVLSRYKFVAKMLANRGRVLEVGIGDGLGAVLVAQAGNHVVGLDIEPFAIENTADLSWTRDRIRFATHDMTKDPYVAGGPFDAAYSVDVIEHIPPELERRFMRNIVDSIRSTGCLVIGTPNKSADQYASSEARAQHVNLKTHAALAELMQNYFHNVFMFGMNDEVVHTGFAPMSHYLFALGAHKR